MRLLSLGLWAPRKSSRLVDARSAERSHDRAESEISQPRYAFFRDKERSARNTSRRADAGIEPWQSGESTSDFCHADALPRLIPTPLSRDTVVWSHSMKAW